MKIFISLPEKSNTKGSKSFFEGISHLKKLGHNVFLNEDQDLKRSDKFLKECDLVIAEASLQDTKVGFELSKALTERKSIIIFKPEDYNFTNLFENIDKNIVFKTYKKNNVTTVFEQSVKEASSQMDSKFILIISPEIEKYLEWASQTKRLHKAQIVRGALEQIIKKDKDYKTFLGD